MSTLADARPGGFVVQFTCCGRDGGTCGRATWREADELREAYVAAEGHARSAIIIAGFEGSPSATGQSR